MSHPADASSALGVAFMVALMVTGLAVLWRVVLSPAARARRQPPALPPWPGTASDLLLFFLLAISGSILLPLAVRLVVPTSGWSPGALKVASLAAFQLGGLGGIAAYHFGFQPFAMRKAVRRSPTGEGGPVSSAPSQPGIFVSGLATVLIALPLVQGVAVVWQALMGSVGLPVETPDNIQIFIDLPTPLLRVLFGALAIGVAPVAEELVFRAGLFRYFLGRFPRWFALLLPAFVFGAMHLSSAPLESLSSLAPLVTLGVILSLAYERTGRIGTVIVAHALFNLIMVLLVLLGLNA